LNLIFKPLTNNAWDDFQELFGERGACGGCWCMLWRVSAKQFESQKGDGNRRAMKRIVTSGLIPGILAFVGAAPVGWCALGPRDHYPALARSRVMKPVDELPVWSVACLFVDRQYRSKGIATELLKAAVAHAKEQGAEILEGYPVEPKQGKIPPAFAWTGIPKAFERAGFHEVARRSPTRPVMRIFL
jgi:GNAT superfamily N-acetyltransferase